MKPRLIILAAFIVSVFAGSAALGQGIDRDNTVVLELRSDILNFNIALRYDVSWFPSTLYFNRLVAMDYGPNYAIVPDLAESWDISEDGKTYTFHLAENVFWHDGVPFTSADVKYTFEGIREFNGQAASVMSSIAEIQTPDPHTVVVTTKEVDASFLPGIAVYPRTPILPAHLYEGTDWNQNPYNMNPVGTGPFKLERHVPGEMISFVRNEAYFKGAPTIERIVFRIIPDNAAAITALRNGDIDAFTYPIEQRGPYTLIDQLAREPQLKTVVYPSPMVYYFGFDVTEAPYNDVSVRRAVAMAMDRNEIVRRVAGSVGAASEGVYTPAVAWAYNPDARLPEHDPAGAAALLDEAGYPAGADGTRLTLDLWVSRGVEIDMAQILREQLSEVGIRVNISQMEDALMRTLLPELRHDAYLYGNWWGPDPSEWASYTSTNETWTKPMGYSNPEVDALFVKGRQTQDLDERRAAYFAIQEILADELPRIPLIDSLPYSFVYNTRWEGWFTDEPVLPRLDMSRVRLRE